MAPQEDKTHQAKSEPELATPQDSAHPAPEKSYDASTEKAVLNAIEKFPLIGPWLVVIFRKWSWQGLILFLIGFVVGTILMYGLFFFTLIPDSLLPHRLRTTVRVDESNEQLITPKGDLALIEVPDENKWKSWLNDYKLRFRFEIDRLDLAEKPRTNVLTLQNPLAQPTTEFPWRLSVDSDHIIKFARAFRVTDKGLIFPLRSDPDSIANFKVPACIRGDTLVVVVLTVTRPDSNDRTPIFQSSAP